MPPLNSRFIVAFGLREWHFMTSRGLRLHTEEVNAGQRDGPDVFVMELDQWPFARTGERYPTTANPVFPRTEPKKQSSCCGKKGTKRISPALVRDANEDEYFIGKYPGLGLPRNDRERPWVSPTWAPDSMRMAFAALTHPPLIWAVDIDGSNLVELTNGLGGRNPVWQSVSPSATATSVESQSWGRIKSLLSTGTR